MIYPELIKYIQEAKSVGLEEGDIFDNLFNAGWGRNDIVAAMGYIENAERKDARGGTRGKALSIVSVGAVIAVGAFAAAVVVYEINSFTENINSSYIANRQITANVYNTLSDYARQQSIDTEESTMLFVGDIMVSAERGTGRQIEKNDSYEYPFLNIADTLVAADLVFGNLEGPISARGNDGGGLYSFRADPGVVSGLKFAGFDVLSVANNHIFDWGKEAFEDTLEILTANGITPVGGGYSYEEANSPVIRDVDGARVAFLAYSDVLYESKYFEARGDTPGKSSFEIKRTLLLARYLKEFGLADIVVVSFHWGEEYETRSRAAQQKTARALVDAGVDIVVGHHPHVVQEVERYQDGWIAYSLGNFVFDQDFSEETMRGLMLEVVVRENAIISVNPVDIIISDTYQPGVLDM